ncbi:hypothetical protein PR202_ga20974 [Eleusine coracana subsp. coracana]|uniref:Uncharacterized protein n=1 Tax=Eleusine coracana subsp. coracana TaxID=191504 RepID=A0AAV5CYQ1_ELECO|nr:hypothetical protein PR202_ga20974 [Eleusine coracana subsp. coracana]
MAYLLPIKPLDGAGGYLRWKELVLLRLHTVDVDHVATSSSTTHRFSASLGNAQEVDPRRRRVPRPHPRRALRPPAPGLRSPRHREVPLGRSGAHLRPGHVHRVVARARKVQVRRGRRALGAARARGGARLRRHALAPRQRQTR